MKLDDSIYKFKEDQIQNENNEKKIESNDENSYSENYFDINDFGDKFGKFLINDNKLN